MAFAVMLGGTGSAKWLGQPELVGYEVFVIGRHENNAWSI